MDSPATADYSDPESTRTPQPDRPAATNERIDSLDVIRGVALLGILVMNIRAFAMVTAAYANLSLWGDTNVTNTVSYYVTSVLADQKFMSLFSLLFGAGVLLMTDRAEQKSGRAVRRHLRRMAWLLVFGIIHGYLIWWGDILTAYAVAGSVAVIARRWPARRQFIVGSLLLLIPALFSVGLHAAFPEMTPEELTELKDFAAPGPEALAKETAAYRGSYLENVEFRAPKVFEFQTQFLMFFIWRIMGLMILGMALLKSDVLTGRKPLGFYRNLAWVGLTSGIALTGYGAHTLIASDFEMKYAMGLGGLWNYFGSLLGAAGWLGLVMYFRARDCMPGLRARLAAVGRMAFTNYILHSVICTTVFYGFGFGLFGSLQPPAQFGIVAAVWALQLALSPWWLERYRFGPLEWCWRALTYGERPPMRR